MQKRLAFTLGALLMIGQVQSGVLVHQCRSHGQATATCACAKHATKQPRETRVQSDGCCQMRANAPVTAATTTPPALATAHPVSVLVPITPLIASGAASYVDATTDLARSSPPLFQSNCVYRL